MLLFAPQVKFLPFSMAAISLQKSALDNVNMDYKGLESTFEFPDPLQVFKEKVRYYVTWGYKIKPGSRLA